MLSFKHIVLFAFNTLCCERRCLDNKLTLAPSQRFKGEWTPPFKACVPIFALFTIQGVEIYFNHQVIGTKPSKKAKWAQVKVFDLQKEEEYTFETEHVVLNVPATVRQAAEISGTVLIISETFSQVDLGTKTSCTVLYTEARQPSRAPQEDQRVTLSRTSANPS